MTDLVMGAITNYTWFDVEPWLTSLRLTGYNDDVALACFNVKKTTIDKLKSLGVICIVMGVDIYGDAAYPKKEQWNICVERFLVYWRFLSNTKYNRVLLTDVKDVIFQRNPFHKDFDNKEINVSSEYIQYQNEDWGKQNLTLSLSEQCYDEMKLRAIINAGVIEGDQDYIKDLCAQIFLICQGRPPYIQGGGGPDQAVYNYIMSMNPWIDCWTYAPEHWACQAGTIADPNKIDKYEKFLYTSKPTLKNDLIFTGTGIPYFIVHQYDRVPDWKPIIETKYRNKL